MTEIKNLILPNYGIIRTKVPTDLLKFLQKESNNKRNLKKFVSGITKTEAGDRPGVAKHLYVSDEGTEKLQKYIDTLIVEYNKLYPNYFQNIEVLNKSCPLWLGKPWFNYQKKNEYIPLHAHEGILSYSIWIQVPKGCDTIYEWSYGTVIGKHERSRMNITHEHEGEIVLFTAPLHHSVYPFTESNKTRISIAGNIFLKVDNSRI